MKRNAVILLVFLVLIVACSGDSDDKALHETLNGTWVSDIVTVTIDFNEGTYRGVALGTVFDRKLTLVEESANVVIFKSDDNIIIAQIHADDNTITLTKQMDDGSSGIPVTLRKQD